jgi:hypothetical protein
MGVLPDQNVHRNLERVGDALHRRDARIGRDTFLDLEQGVQSDPGDLGEPVLGQAGLVLSFELRRQMNSAMQTYPSIQALLRSNRLPLDSE